VSFGDFVPSFILLSIVASIAMQMIGRGTGQLKNIVGDGFDVIDDTGVTFDDVAGIDESKEELVEVLRFLKNAKAYKEAGATIPKGCLLYGEPGTGKTLCAKALAGEANVPFISVSASQFVELFVGLGASRIRQLFKKARDKGTCIIFIDEIDAIGKKRSNSAISGGGNDEREQTLNQLLLEMDGFSSDDNIIVVAATNRVDNLDNALLRPGRFDRKIKVDLPDVSGRERILSIHAKNKKGDWPTLLPKIAKLTPGCSGADLANIMNEAAIVAARSERVTIEFEDLNEAFEKVTIGLKKSGRMRSQKVLQTVAFHEAGHALVGKLVGEPPTKVTIVPRGGSGGFTIFEPRENEMISREYLIHRMMIGLGGTIAEEIAFGPDNITTGASSDLVNVTNIARSMITTYGLSSMGKRVITQNSNEVEEEIKKITDKVYTDTKQLLTDNISELTKLAHRLIEEETINF
jgi:cell division protease FtsH